MKKPVFFLLCIACSFASYAQAGDTSVGLLGGYDTQYKDGMYGLNISYHLIDQAEVGFTGLFNPNISQTDEFNRTKVENLSLYSLNLDLRYYLLLTRSWGMGPFLGGQHLIVQNKEYSYKDFSVFGFNIGWHIKANITEEIKLTTGWRYTMANEGIKHHCIYLGIGYTFSLH
ncbi:MAG: porin family protein [Candidatus Symbiothrix sp.]|jgi:hypothetical protein|nr:porin family protein [Candidatus Symbiothrix sp.]